MALGVRCLGIGGGGGGGGRQVSGIDEGIGGGGGGKDGGNRQIGCLEAILRQKAGDSALLRELELIYCFERSSSSNLIRVRFVIIYIYIYIYIYTHIYIYIYIYMDLRLVARGQVLVCVL